MTHAPIVPCLWLDDQAEAAAEFYVAAFRGGSVEAVAHYPESMPNPSGRPPGSVLTYDGAGGPAGTVKHGRFALAGQPMVAMDSAFEHGFTFSEAVSLQVMCADQAEVDRLWATLAEGGEVGPCGWLKDRFGVSWQVVPEALLPLLTGPDPAARDRTFAAMLEMGKLDLEALRRARDGLDLPNRRSVS